MTRRNYGGGNTYGRAQAGYDANPAIGGLIAAALGAIVGAAIPPTELERQKLGSLGQQARDAIGGQKDRALDKAHALLDKNESEGKSETANGGNAHAQDDRQNFTGGLSPQAGIDGGGTLI